MDRLDFHMRGPQIEDIKNPFPDPHSSEAKELRVAGYGHPPYTIAGSGPGKETGIDVELARVVAQREVAKKVITLKGGILVECFNSQTHAKMQFQ